LKKLQKEIGIVYFSNNNLSRRIKICRDHSCTTERVPTLYYALQSDESTGVANLASLLVFVRYINEDNGIAEEELLFCRPLKERTTGEDTSMFNLTNVENEIRD
jgi:hypothetical protein